MKKARTPEEKKARDPERKQRLRLAPRASAGRRPGWAVRAVSGRLRQLQILDSEYRLLSDENRLSCQLTAPSPRRHLRPLRQGGAESRESSASSSFPPTPRIQPHADALARIVPIPARSATACSESCDARAPTCRCSWSKT
jgi:hypothetical protein